jgi:hypothetical protein
VGDDPDQEQDQEEEQESTQVSQSSDQPQSIDNSSSSSTSIGGSHDTNMAQPADENQAFVAPRKEILTKEDLELFHASPTYANLFEFLEALNESVVGVVSTADCYQSDVGYPPLRYLWCAVGSCTHFI